MSKPTNNPLRFPCPDCGGKMFTRGSEKITDTVRELRLVCADHDCGAYYHAQMALIRAVRRGTKPNPEVRLPFANRPVPANENHRIPANDTGMGAAIAAAMST